MKCVTNRIVPEGAPTEESTDGQPNVSASENEQGLGEDHPQHGDEPAMSVPDATLRPFVRALLALALELQERETKRP